MIVSEGETILGTLEEYKPVKVSEVDLKPYLGSYTSEELSTTYTMIEKGGKLIATHPRSSDIPLNLVKLDVFYAGGNTILFTKNNSDSITGLEVSTGRVKNLKFSKD